MYRWNLEPWEWWRPSKGRRIEGPRGPGAEPRGIPTTVGGQRQGFFYRRLSRRGRYCRTKYKGPRSKLFEGTDVCCLCLGGGCGLNGVFPTFLWWSPNLPHDGIYRQNLQGVIKVKWGHGWTLIQQDCGLLRRESSAHQEWIQGEGPCLKARKWVFNRLDEGGILILDFWWPAPCEN